MKRKIAIFPVIWLLLFIPLLVTGSDDYVLDDPDIMVIKRMNIKTYRSFSGVTIPYNKALIRSDVQVKIDRVHVVNGEWIEKGKKIYTLSLKEILKQLKSLENEIQGWEKILSERRKWKVRNRNAENEAISKIKRGKILASRYKKLKMNPFVFSSISGRISSLMKRGDKAAAGFVLAKVLDDYLVKIELDEEQKKYFSEGDQVVIKNRSKELELQGRVRSQNKKLVILINNTKLKISSDSVVKFSKEFIYENVILLDNSLIGSDNNKYYVYVLKGTTALKTYVNLNKIDNIRYLVLSGLKEGEKVLSPLPATNRDSLTVNLTGKSIKPISVKKGIKQRKRKKTDFSRGKKREFVLSIGYSVSKPENLNLRQSGIDNLLGQYSEFYGITNNHSGTFKENISGIPFNFTVNLFLKSGLIVKGGFEYSASSNSSSKLYSLDWPDTDEKFNYTVSNRVTNIMPFLGIEKRFSSFALYAIGGINMTTIKHSNHLNYNMGSYSLKSSDEFKIKGSGPGIILGLQYMISVGKKNSIFIKTEYLFSKLSGFTGTKTVDSSDSSGKTLSSNIEGDAYIYEYNPYDQNWVPWWDISTTEPSGDMVRYVKKFSVGVSKLRLMIGFAF